MTHSRTRNTLLASCLLVALTISTGASCWSLHQRPHHSQHQHQAQQQHLSQIQNQNQNLRASLFAARRAADDSRPLLRVAGGQQPAESQEAPVVVGKFKAPAPERLLSRRVPKTSEFAAQTVGASFRVSADESAPEKVVQGVAGGSLGGRQREQSTQRTVGAKMRVSDEGLNLPPSKLSADIYGNLAEIVTAPPDAAENDFLVPQSGRFGRRP